MHNKKIICKNNLGKRSKIHNFVLEHGMNRILINI